MYVDTSTLRQKGKAYTRHLLRESYREEGKVRHRTIANLSRCSEQEVEAIKLALRHKEDLRELISLQESLELRKGPSIGAVWLLYSLAKELKIVEVLGSNREGKLALWQVMARIIDQGSRLSAVRLALSKYGLKSGSPPVNTNSNGLVRQDVVRNICNITFFWFVNVLPH